MEIWKKIPSHPKYEASSFGRIRNAKNQKPLKITIKEGYEKVNINQYPYSVHRLVAASFIPIENMNGNDVDHIDWDCLNNHVSNLRWLSRSENLKNRITNTRSFSLFKKLLSKNGDDKMCDILESI